MYIQPIAIDSHCCKICKHVYIYILIYMIHMIDTYMVSPKKQTC